MKFSKREKQKVGILAIIQLLKLVNLVRNENF